MGENIRGKWKIKMNDLKSSQIIESLKLEKEIWCLSLLGFTAGSGAEKYYHRVVFLGRSFCQCCAGRRNPKVRGLARKLLE